MMAVMVITAVNRLLQLLGDVVGVEVGDFWEWLRSKTRRKKKKTR
jgi:hypothetical protein